MRVFHSRTQSRHCAPGRALLLEPDVARPKDRQLSKLNGKVALIANGNSGIGVATAKQFVAMGACVYITGRRQEDLDSTATAIEKNVTAVQGLEGCSSVRGTLSGDWQFGCASCW